MVRSKYICLALSMITLLAMPREVFAFQIAVSPMKFEVPIGGRPVTRSMKVINSGKTPLEVGVSIGHWDLDENNNVRSIKPTAQSLDQWIVASPLKLKIPAGKTRTLRFSIRPYTKPSIGEHRAMIFLDQGGAPTKGPKGVSFRFRIGVPVYGNVGNPVRRAAIKSFVAKPARVGFNIKNDGKYNVRFSGDYGIWEATKFPGVKRGTQQLRTASKPKTFVKPKTAMSAGELPTTPVLPGYQRTIPVPLKSNLAPGEYKMLLAGKLGDTPLNKTYSFTVQ